MNRSFHQTTRRRSIMLASMACLVLAWACDDPTDVSPEAAAVTNIEVRPGETPLTAVISAESDAGCLEITVQAEGEEPLRSETCSATGEFEAPIGRLLQATNYVVSVRHRVTTGVFGPTSEVSFQSGTLPEPWNEISTTVEGDPTVPLVLLQIRIGERFGFVVVDRLGRIVWFYEYPGEGRSNPIAQRANGNYVIVVGRTGSEVGLPTRAIEITPDGEIVRELVENDEFQRFHHEIMETPEGTVLIATLDSRVEAGGEEWVGDRIIEWVPETGVVTERWDIFDFYDPISDLGVRSRPDDWGHLNSIALADDGTVIVSLQYLDQIVALTPDFSEIEWKLGGPGSDFVLEGAPFSGQHSASMPQPGRVLLFDNGRERVSGEQYSIGLEYELDEAEGIARPAWTFRPDPDLYSRNLSSIYRLDDGSTLVHFGSSSMVRPETFQVTREGEVLWHLAVDGIRQSYRAIPLQSVAGETEADGM